jgi:cbb3-type cytochrome oxidase maturation protein
MTNLIFRPGRSKYFYTSKFATMSVIILLLVASLSVALLFLGAFLWSVRNKQYDDDYSPPRRILFDDSPTLTNNDNKELTSK